jgi:hypothetical protein
VLVGAVVGEGVVAVKPDEERDTIIVEAQSGRWNKKVSLDGLDQM